MGKETIRLRFNGPAVDEHTMDVVDLAPALLAVGELCKLANREINQDQTHVNVLVRADQEHHCFELSLEIIQSLLSGVQGLIRDPKVANTKEILEWIGIIGGGAIGGGMGLLKFLAWLKGRSHSTKIITQEGQDNIQVSVEGDENVISIAPQVSNLSKNPTIRRLAAELVAPTLQEGYDSIEIEDTYGQTEIIEEEDARGIYASHVQESRSEKTLDEPQEFKAWISVYGPVYDTAAPRWRFKFGDRIEYMNISETKIAEDAIKRGGALISDAYYATIRMVQSITETGSIKNSFSVVKVEKFEPGKLQIQKAFEFLKEGEGEGEGEDIHISVGDDPH